MSGGDNSTDQDTDEQLVSLGFQVGAYVVVMVIALVGNILVILTYKNDRELKNLVMGKTLCYMAIADLITTIFGIPSMISLMLNNNKWLIHGEFGQALCKLHSYAFEVSIAVSALSIAAIAGERFLSVFFPLKQILTVKVVHIIGAISWFLSCCFYVPILYTRNVYHYGNIMHCMDVTAQFAIIEPWRKVEASFFGLLFLVTFVLYIAIVIKVTLKASIPGRVVTENSHVARNRTNRRVIRQGLGVITVHYLCWLPYLLIYNICVVFGLQVKYLCFKSVIFQDFFIFFLGFSNAALNPILYTATNAAFRKGCKNVFRNLCRSQCAGQISPAVNSKNTRVCAGSTEQNQQQPNSHAATNDQQSGGMTSEQNNTDALELRGEIVQVPTNGSPRVILVTTR